MGGDLSPEPSNRCSTLSALIARLYSDTFRGEPAITRFDWLFTPRPGSHEEVVLPSLRASTGLSLSFTLPRSRSSGFKSQATDYSRFHTRFRFASPHNAVKLASG